MNLPQARLVVVRSTDISRLATFYRNLGIVFEEHRHGSGPVHYSADLAGFVFEIYPAKKPDDVDRTTRLGFTIQNVHEAIVDLRSLNFEIVEEAKQSEWGLRAVVRDPDGRSVELYG